VAPSARGSITAGVRVLRAAGVAFTEHAYPYQDRGGTAWAAESLGLDHHAVIKTLVMADAARQPLVVLMHGDREVSTRALARHLGTKSVAPCAPEEAQRHSGYQVGGTSPFGLRKPLRIFVERSILELVAIYINGGRRGCSCASRPRTWCACAVLRRSTSLDRDADELGIRQDADFRDAHLYPRRTKLAGEEGRHALGEGLDQPVVLLGRERADAKRDLLVVNGVGDAVAREHRRARQADVEIDGERLHDVTLAAVDADQRFDAQVPDEDRIHRAPIL
jgi:Cys-tRNA(Pro) deacylase